MLGRAHLRLGDRADLRHGDAAHLPFPDASMDLVTATLMLHELTEEDRDAVLREVPRSSYGGGAGARLMLDPIVGNHI